MDSPSKKKAPCCIVKRGHILWFRVAVSQSLCSHPTWRGVLNYSTSNPLYHWFLPNYRHGLRRQLGEPRPFRNNILDIRENPSNRLRPLKMIISGLYSGDDEDVADYSHYRARLVSQRIKAPDRGEPRRRHNRHHRSCVWIRKPLLSPDEL
jgi:hypothetical protein